ncbi:MAG: alpha/beta fold hydrolase [Planctomycetes bacterium]|nr:alpha/beta fold hydrolase [Planctomycetota bacterium]
MLSNRRTLLLLAFLPWLPACAALSGSGGSVPRHDAHTFFASTSYAGASFAHDGRSLLVTSDKSGIFNAYELDIATGELAQLTHSSSNAISSIAWFPDDRRFLFTADQGGNELHHVYVRHESGEEHDLTPGNNLKAQFLGWCADERSFFVLTNERDPQFFDLYRYHFGPRPIEAASTREIAPGYQRELLFQNPGGFDLSGVTRDGVWVALTKTTNNADSDLYLAATAEPGERLHVTPHHGRVLHAFADFAPDGSRLYYTTNESSEFDSVWSYDLAARKHAPVFAADWDVAGYRFSEDGHWFTTAVNADARTIVRVFEAESGREVVLPKLPAGDITGVSFEQGGKRLACYVNGDASPSNLYLLDLASGAHERLTDALNPAIAESHLVEAEVVRYPSFDGLAVPALLYQPRGAASTQRAPAIVWVHGGPGGQSRRGYNPMIQHLVNHGYAVLAVNNRGSSGYGKTFFHLDDRKHGDVDLKDCIFGRRYLESLDWVDGERVAIMGGSYGGYMVCAALAFAPDEFDAGLDIFGVTNWIRTLENIPAWWAEARDGLFAELGDPATDRASLEQRSPLIHAKNITKPLLVVQGKNDPRVLEAESQEIVAAVKANGVAVEYVLFPDEGHGFRNKENRIRASEAYLAFLEKHLRLVPAN